MALTTIVEMESTSIEGISKENETDTEWFSKNLCALYLLIRTFLSVATKP